jgi:hypothetical protein
MVETAARKFGSRPDGRMPHQGMMTYLLLLGLLALGACGKADSHPSPDSPREPPAIESQSELAFVEDPELALPSVVEPADPDDSIFPLSFLINDATDYSGCNPDVDGESACF